MKHPFKKQIFKAILVFISTVSVVSAADSQTYDIFSHTVLRLPYELQSDEPWIRFITTQEQWESFYTELLSQNLGGDDLDSSIAVPEIDFTNYQVVAGGIGVRPSSGFELSIYRVDEFTDYLLIHVFIVSPGPDCGVGAVITYPYTAAQIKKTDKPLRFAFSYLTRFCSVRE